MCHNIDKSNGIRIRFALLFHQLVCMSCKRKLFDNAVISISLDQRDEFKNKLESIRPGLFDETIKTFPSDDKDAFLCSDSQNNFCEMVIQT